MAKFTQAKPGLFFPSEENLSIEVEGGYDKIMNHLILCDPKAFATPDTLVKHMKELEAQVEIYVRNSLQYCEMIKDKPGLFIETRRKRSKVRLVTKQYLDHANIILRQLLSSHEIHGGSLVVTNNALSTDEVTHVTKQSVEHTDIVLRSHEIHGESLSDPTNAPSTDEVTHVTKQSVEHTDIVLRSHEIHGESLSDPTNVPSTDEVTHVTKQSVEQADIVLNSHETNGMSVIDNDDGINNVFVESPTNLSSITPLCVPVLDNLEPIAREATVLDLSSIEYSTQVALSLKSSALILKGIISHSDQSTHNAIDPPSLSFVPEKIDKYENGYDASPAPVPVVIYSPYEPSPAPVPVEKCPPYEEPVEFVLKYSRPSVSLHFPPFPKHNVADKGMRKMIKWFLPHKSVKWKIETRYSNRYLFLIIIMSRFIMIY